jgi:HPt (histidine-containing phosphotransfer) domain-containing protein
MSTNLPILNYDFALTQLGGNEALLIKMLGRFLSEFVEVSNEVVALLNNDDIAAAKMKVHTVKGISGNLGLQALYDCATRFDAELRSGNTHQATIDEFDQLLADTCIEISKVNPVESAEHLSASTYSPETSKLELVKRLKRNEFIDDDTLSDLIAGLGMNETTNAHLVSLIEELQYPEAITIIEEKS